jgi:hypothetical protein
MKAIELFGMRVIPVEVGNDSCAAHDLCPFVELECEDICQHHLVGEAYQTVFIHADQLPEYLTWRLTK